MKKNKTVYIALTADILHHGHINLIEKGRMYGEIIIGLLTDKAVADNKRLPYLNYEQRKKILINFKGVSKIVPQKEWDYSNNIKKIRPDFLIHGDEWRKGNSSILRKNAIKALNQYGGKLIEIAYTKGVSSSALISHQNSISITSDIRRGIFKRLVESKKISRFSPFPLWVPVL